MSVLDKVIAAVTPPESDEDRAEARAKARATAEPGDWFSMILDHHLLLEDAFAATKTAGDAASRTAALKKLGIILTGHAIAEESVVYPSASIVQGYQPFNVQTRDGQSYSGLLVRQTTDAVWLRGADQAEVKVDAQRIASMTESTVSLMPQGLDATLSRDEFRDLLAYLQSLKRLSSAAAERSGGQ